MAAVPTTAPATGGQEAACVGGARSSTARQCEFEDETCAVTSAPQSSATHMEPRGLNGPTTTPVAPMFVERPQQQHVGRPELAIPHPAWPEQNSEEQRQELMSRVERNKAYGAYLLHQADLRRQRDLLERLTRHNYSAGTPMSSTHEAFTAPSVADTAPIAVRAAVSKVPWLTKSAWPAQNLCARLPQGNDGSSLSQQLLVQQQLLHQQQQCLLHQQQQQELLRQQQEQQGLLQQQQRQLLQQQQQRFLKDQQPLEQKQLRICSNRASEPRVAFSDVQPEVRQLHDSSLYTQKTSAEHQAISEAAPSVIDHSTLPPATFASAVAADYSAAHGHNITRSGAATFDAELSLPTKQTTYFPKMSASSLPPAFLPRLRRVLPQPDTGLVTAAALQLQQQHQQWRRCEDERRAYGEFLKSQIEQRKAAEKEVKELDKRLYGKGGGSGVTAGSLGRIGVGAGAALRSSNEKAYLGEESQFCVRPPSQLCPHIPAQCVEPHGERGSTEVLGEAFARIKNEAHSSGDPGASNRLESTPLKTCEEAYGPDGTHPSNGCTRRNPSSPRARSSSSQPVRKITTERTTGIDDEGAYRFSEEREATAAACALKKKKQQEYREFLLMQIEEKRNGGGVGGRVWSPSPEEQGEKRFRSRSCCLKASVPVRDFDEFGCNEAVSSTGVAAAGSRAADGDPTAAPSTLETGQERLVSCARPHSRRGRVGRNTAKSAVLAHTSRGILGNAEEHPQIDEAQEEQQRLMREHERRKAYQAALLQQIRERENDRARERQEKLREQEKERQLLYEALEEERRNMRTGRKNVNNLAFTKKDTNTEEFATVATTAGAELDTPRNLASLLQADRSEEAGDCNGNACTGRKLHLDGEGMPRAFGASPVAGSTAAKQGSPRNYAVATPTAALSRSASSAVLPCLPALRKLQKQQHLETVSGLEADKKVDNLCAGVAALHGDVKGPEFMGNIASCLQTVHLEMQRQQEELRSMKLQQQLSTLQQRVQQDELTRLLSSLSHNNKSSTTHGLTASGHVTAEGNAVRTEGVNVYLENQHPLLMQPGICPETLVSPSCRAKLCDGSSGGPTLTAPSLLHGGCFARGEKISAEEETAATFAAGLASAKGAPHAGRNAIEQNALCLEQAIGTRPIYTSTHVFAADLFPEQQNQHFLQCCQHQHHPPLLQENVDMHHHKGEHNAKVVHLREPETAGAATMHGNPGVAPTTGVDGSDERCAGTGHLKDGPATAATGLDKRVPFASPPRRLRSNRVNEIIDNFTRWLKPSSFPKKESRQLPPTRSASFSTLSGASLMQSPPEEGHDAAANSFTFSRFLLDQQQDGQWHSQAQHICSMCGALKGSCDCSSSSSCQLLGRQEDTRSRFLAARRPGKGVHNSELPPSSPFLLATRETVSSVNQFNNNWRRGCKINHLAAQSGSDPHGCSASQAFQFARAGPVIGLPAPAPNSDGRNFCVTCPSAATGAAVVATTHGPSSCGGAAGEPPLSCSCSCYAQNTSVASCSCPPHTLNTCNTAIARRHYAYPVPDHHFGTPMNACTHPQQRTHACCFSSCEPTNAASLLHCPHGQQDLQVPCSGYKPQRVLQTLPSGESQCQPQEEVSYAGEPEQHERFVEIRDVQPLEAPSFVWSVDEKEQQQEAKKKAVPDFMRFSVKKSRRTSAAGVLDRSSSLASPENRFLLRRWLGGILPPPPSKEFAEVEQDQQQQQQDPQQQQQEQAAEGEQQHQQQHQLKEGRRSLWRGGRDKAQQRGSVARTQSAAAAAAALEKKSRRGTSTVAGSNSSDKIGDVKRGTKSSPRALAAMEVTPAAGGKTRPGDVGAAVADASLQRQDSRSSVKGLLGLLGHVWDRRQRVEREKVLDEEEVGPHPLRLSERMQMRLSWEADQPWDLLLQQGATHGERLLSATAAELQRCVEKDEEEKQRRQQLQQQARMQHLEKERQHAVVSFGPNAEAGEGSTNKKESLVPNPPDTKQQKQQSRGWRRPSRSATERRRTSTPQQPGNKSARQQPQEEGVPHGSSNAATAAGSLAGKQQNQTSDRGSSHPQRGPQDSPFTSAPSSPAVPPEPHRKPEGIKR